MNKCNPRLLLDKDEIKAFVQYNWHQESYDMTMVHGVGLVNPLEVPDFRTNEQGAIDIYKTGIWTKRWAGLLWCLQSAFYYVRYDTAYKDFLNNRMKNNCTIWIDYFWDYCKTLG